MFVMFTMYMYKVLSETPMLTNATCTQQSTPYPHTQRGDNLVVFLT